MAIDAIGGLPPIQPTQPGTPAAAPTAEPGFSDKLSNAVSGVETLQDGANEALEQLASGENVDLHGTMIALEKADIALRMSVSVRDKLIGAYEQIMNMAL